MNRELITLIIDDITDILEIKNIWNVDKYMKRFNTISKCSDNLKRLLYEETEYCLEVFNKFVKDVIVDCINNNFTYDKLIKMFKCKHIAKKEKYNEIISEFIKLIIANVDEAVIPAKFIQEYISYDEKGTITIQLLNTAYLYWYNNAHDERPKKPIDIIKYFEFEGKITKDKVITGIKFKNDIDEDYFASSKSNSWSD
jgi:hypothetical protein